ncbi:MULTISPECIES: type II toxin-antitoxin system RelE/ParE family toxin [Brenneria]|uniref:Type II toxin-antitoxin system RelE/ParE family toxin n=1 Tax=Brenneria nigrifluens DSM 30175 = ATCC 13028 TaxID=1121120 RepID=A0A2U1UP12_9GAMM|nr:MULTISPECIES: type II toxin-antitoxin system RelE/ParE family toxin [Brenneria]EHD23466.1 plasmid stabilization system [Brenneria sp. EniD312]PWC23396.1 type II toxin-antitoxin system RelE/ParE family toxin [Brenneria nigrifluens DSM 30175 = ATCC 13028]QCR06394.1 type II toxin-antitoxin system RelE/ParE family toxin [Brenneria nigrifluens DSM 30175 = ATCC 13028]
MAQIVWTEPALDQLNEIAEYVALDNPMAASSLVRKVFAKVERLERFPQSDREPPELPNSVYREVVCSPCRVFYRNDENTVIILHLIREERLLRLYLLGSGDGGLGAVKQ